MFTPRSANQVPRVAEVNKSGNPVNYPAGNNWKNLMVKAADVYRNKVADFKPPAFKKIDENSLPNLIIEIAPENEVEKMNGHEKKGKEKMN